MMTAGRKAGLFLAAALAGAAPVFSQDGEDESPVPQTIPQGLLQPWRGEFPRYPQDIVIGELGQGKAPAEAYQFARNLLSGLVQKGGGGTGSSGVGAARLDALSEELKAVEPLKYRLGGGREEADGTVSFVVRFIGRERWISGELYLRQEEEWELDDLILEESRDIAERQETYRFDFTPYERFY
ncbi:MAG: hypothetical protein LBL43_00820 [Treponema sp.]|jgi:hypothetical protein|nr:hypothetical protein [Treponema sp.]